MLYTVTELSRRAVIYVANGDGISPDKRERSVSQYIINDEKMGWGYQCMQNVSRNEKTDGGRG